MSESTSSEAGIRYVLVPVPSEFVLDVMRWVLFRAPEGVDSSGRDEIRIEHLVDGLAAGELALLELVISASLKGETVRLVDIADELDCDAQTARSMIATINGNALSGGRVLIGLQTEQAVGVHGNVGNMSFVSMRPREAQLARNALRRKSQTDQ